jgi:O-methyltransferase
MYTAEEKTVWIRDEYDGFRAQSRRNLFMSIAIFCNQNKPIDGYYLEFGCHLGRTMRFAWDATKFLFEWTYVGFDSFEGLPEIDEIDRMPIWQKGSVKTTEEDFIRTVVDHGMPRERLITVKGFFKDSLTEELKQRLLPVKAAVIYVDCDLYASTVPVLEFAKDFLQRGTVIVFDDWFCFHGDPARGERRALRSFLERNPSIVLQDFFQNSEVKTFIVLDPGGGQKC